MSGVRKIAVELLALAANAEDRRPLLAFRPSGCHDLDLHAPPKAVLESTEDFLTLGMSAVRGVLDALGARAAGLLLPVRTLWEEFAVCPYLDAEALVVVAAEAVEGGAASVGITCPIHLLPTGWNEAHTETNFLAAPLRQAVAGVPLADESTLFPFADQ
jgi:hypothetical protein